MFGQNKERDESVFDFEFDDLEGEGSYRVLAEFKTRHLLLEAPGFSVDVEDSSAEEIAEDGGERFSLGEVVEPGLEHVFHVVGVGGDGVSEDVDVDGFCRRVSEEVSVPVAEVVEGFGPA